MRAFHHTQQLVTEARGFMNVLTSTGVPSRSETHLFLAYRLFFSHFLSVSLFSSSKHASGKIAILPRHGLTPFIFVYDISNTQATDLDFLKFNVCLIQYMGLYGNLCTQEAISTSFIKLRAVAIQNYGT